jgi:hypothetical protein
MLKRMAWALKQRWQRLSSREKRMLFYFLAIVAVAAWRLVPRYWKPTTVTETEHYQISSTATPQQTDAMGRAVEMLYRVYADRFARLPAFQSRHPKLKLLLYKDRDELHRINPGLGWAEAFYRKPYCRAYYSAGEANPYHWMLHEAVHQLNQEVAQLDLAKWLDEGLAEYLSTSRVRDGELRPGTIDPYTYPVWWNAKIAAAPDLQENLRNGSVIPLRAIITDDGGPSMDENVNLYYLHWWTLAHYLFESEKYRDAAMQLLVRGGSLEAFEELIGPVDVVQEGWHAHVRRIKAELENPDVQSRGVAAP